MIAAWRLGHWLFGRDYVALSGVVVRVRRIDGRPGIRLRPGGAILMLGNGASQGAVRDGAVTSYWRSLTGPL